MEPLVARVLTPEQQKAIDFFRAFNVPAQWFIGAQDEDGRVEVLALGADFAWSFIVSADGQDISSSEATLGEWSTGIEV